MDEQALDALTVADGNTLQDYVRIASVFTLEKFDFHPFHYFCSRLKNKDQAEPTILFL